MKGFSPPPPLNLHCKSMVYTVMSYWMQPAALHWSCHCVKSRSTGPGCCSRHHCYVADGYMGLNIFGLGDNGVLLLRTCWFYPLGTKLWYNFILPLTESCHPQYSTSANVQVILTCDASHVLVDVGPAGSTPCSPLCIHSVCSHILFHWQNKWPDKCRHAEHFKLVPCSLYWKQC